MQVIVRRSRTVSVQPTPKPAEAPQRRLVLRSNRTEKLAVDRQAILEHLKSISEAEEAIDRATAMADDARAKIEELMKANKISVIDNGKLLAEIEEGFTRQTRKIDPKKFRTKVTNAVFWECAEISTTKAAQHLGDKEINAIADVVPSKSTGYHLKVRPLKNKK